jgi:hypothetical protein
MARVKKALIAGLGAGVAAAVASIVQSGAMTQDQIVKAIGVGVAAALAVGWATYKARNAVGR